jgi:membrane protein YdbS with pleckstrin-like domain
MYTLFKDFALHIMKAPTRPPEPPAGSHEHTQIYRASPKFLTYRMLGFWLIFGANWLIPWGILLTGLATGETPPIVIGLVLMPVLAVVQLCYYFAIRIDYDMRYYIVTDRSLRVREGAFIVKEMTLTYANIQNIRVVQGPLLRLFGIWHLQVDTAGGGASQQQGHPGANAHRVRMAGIENAREVRDTIQSHLRLRGASAGLGDPDDLDDNVPRPATSSHEVLKALRDLKRATSALRSATEPPS